MELKRITPPDILSIMQEHHWIGVAIGEYKLEHCRCPITILVEGLIGPIVKGNWVNINMNLQVELADVLQANFGITPGYHVGFVDGFDNSSYMPPDVLADDYVHDWMLGHADGQEMLRALRAQQAAGHIVLVECHQS